MFRVADGHGSFTSTIPLSAGTHTHVIAIGYLDGDSKLDLVTPSSGRRSQIILLHR